MRKLNLWSAAIALAGLSAGAHALPAGGLPAFGHDGLPGKSIEGFTAPAAASKAQKATQMAELHRWLTSEAVLAKRAPLSVTLSQQERFSIGAIKDCPDCAAVESTERRKLVGVAKPVDFRVDLSDFGSAKANAARTSDGGLVWTQAVHSEGASGLRIGFAGLDLPAGAELYVFNRAGEAFGPYTGRGMNGSGELVSNMVSGDTAYVQLRVLGEPTAAELAQLKFRISDVGHIGPQFELARRLDIAASGDAKAFCSYNATCIINGECASWTHLSNLRTAIAHMLYQSGRSYYICTGGLVNNSRNDGTPLFLTANHCIGRDREAQSLEAFFDFRANSCTDDGWCDYSSYAQLRSNFPSTLGATLLAAGSSGDYSLMQLSSAPSGSRHFLGWSTTAVANSDGVDLFRISHPSGAPQAWSTHDVAANDFQCGTLPRGTFIYSRDSGGATEGGSSGSPVLNGSGQVVGQLYGACGSNLNDECDSENNLTVDGALAAYFPNVSAWLDPAGGGGGDPGGEVVASIASVVVSASSKGPWTTYAATVRVVDQDGNPIANATVSGNWSGAVSGSASGTTDGSGTANVNGGKTRSGGSAEFCVTGVAGSGVTFDGTSACDSN